MATVQVKANLTIAQLLEAVGQMSREDLDRFVEQVMLLRADQRAARLSQVDSELLGRVNRGLAEQDQQRLNEFVARREGEDLTDDENAEYLRLVALSEALNVERMKALAELARSRRSTLRDVMRDLGIKTPAHA